VTQAQPTEPLVLNDASFFVAGKKYNIINIEIDQSKVGISCGTVCKWIKTK
jgi:hypothetical protein